MDQSNQTPSSPIFSPADPVFGQNPIQSDLSTSNINASDQSTSVVPAVPFSQPGQAASPSYDPQVVVAPHEAAAVPKETIGFSQAEPPVTNSALTTPVESLFPARDDAVGPAPEPVAPSSPEPIVPMSPPNPPTPLPPQPVLADLLKTDVPDPMGPQLIPDSVQPAAEATQPGSEATSVSTDPAKPAPAGEKSPLEILEEILAEANTEQSKEEDAKKKKEREDREFAEQLAAKEAAFQEQAAVELTQKRQEVEQAKIRRDDVEADLKSQGRGDDNAPDVNDDSLVIRQLEHDKVQ